MRHRQNTKHNKITTEKPKTKITHRWTTTKTHKVHNQTQEKKQTKNTATPPLFSVAFTFYDHFFFFDHFLESLVFQSINLFSIIFFTHFFPSCFFNQSLVQSFLHFSTTSFQSLVRNHFLQSLLSVTFFQSLFSIHFFPITFFQSLFFHSLFSNHFFQTFFFQSFFQALFLRRVLLSFCGILLFLFRLCS